MRFTSFVVMLAFLMSVSNAFAGPRVFTMVEDAYPNGEGNWELENTATFNFHSRSEHNLKLLEMEHELEYGISDKLEVKAAFAWSFDDTPGVHNTDWDSGKAEVAYHFLNPATDDFGLSLIGSVSFGARGMETEQILVLQKDIDNWILTYNLGFLTAIDNAYHDGPKDTAGTLSNNFGVSYSINPHLKVGGELSVQSNFTQWTHYDNTAVYLGPCVNYIVNRHFWVTFGTDFQVTSVKDQPDVLFTLICGIEW